MNSPGLTVSATGSPGGTGRPPEAVGPPLGTAIGRFIVVERLGAGGMGLVLGAYDPALDRKVAIKLLHPAVGDVLREQRTARLLREAQAMARIVHPNVLVVHEVGPFGDQVYVAMEHVDGETLARWLATPRSTALILPRFILAARGLAAAHAMGLVHRDFKPDNVLCSRDGRVLVADFGVVALPAAGEPVDHGVSPLGGELTRDGAVVGTLAYMAPEQRAGNPVDGRADQYAFCVALRAALGPAAPRWVRPILERGLAEDPARRHASMDELERALERGAASRWPVVASAVASAVVVAVAVAVPLAARDRAPSAVPCTGFASRLAGVWDPEVKAAVRRAFLATGPDGERAFDAAAGRLDRYAEAWLAAREDACLATAVRREQSEAILDLRMECLDDRLRELGTLASAFSGADAGLVRRAVPVATGMTPLTGCAAPLANLPRLPADPTRRGEALALRPIAVTARVLMKIGRYSKSVALVESALPSARDSGYPPILTELLILGGRNAHIAGNYDVAADRLQEAVRVADSARDDYARARALAELVFVYGEGQRDFDRAHRVARETDAVLARLGGDKLTELAVRSYEATIYQEAHAYAAALVLQVRAAQLAREVFGPGTYPAAVHLAEMMGTLGSLGDHRRALAAGTAAAALMIATVGHEHPNLARLLTTMGDVKLHMHDAAGALPLLREALGIEERTLPPKAPEIAVTLTLTGDAMLALGDVAGAAAINERGLALAEEVYGADHPYVAAALLGRGRVELALGHAAGAVAPLERALAIRVATHSPSYELDEVRAALAQARVSSR